MKMLTRVRTCLILAVVGTLFAIPAGAGKPKPPPPPPPPTPGPEVYEWRPDLGGWLDTSNNLVWGYSMVAIGGGAAPYSYAQGFAQNYHTTMDAKGDGFVTLATDAYDEAAYYYSIGDTATGDELTAEGDEFAYWSDVCYDAAGYSNWRLPTLSESTNAVSKKLFTYGSEGFNGYRSAPGEEPGMAYGDIPRWSSTLSSNKKQGFTRRWTWQPLSGATGEAPEGYSLDAIIVRTHTP